jgi:hypothetical protein
MATSAGWLLKQRAVGLLGASSCVSLLGARPRFAGSILEENQPRKNPSTRLGHLRGDLSLENLAPIYKEFQRWKTIFVARFSDLLNTY